MEKTSNISITTKFYIVLTIALLSFVIGSAGLIHSLMNSGSSGGSPSDSKVLPLNPGQGGQLETLPGGVNEVTPDGPAQNGVPQHSTSQ